MAAAASGALAGSLGAFSERYRRVLGAAARLPEHREIELYDKRKKLHFEEVQARETWLDERLGAVRIATAALDDALEAADPMLCEGKTSWEKYLALPRTTATEKMAAEVYRTLRILRIAMTHTQGRIEVREGVIWFSCHFGRCALSVNLTPAGLDLLCGFVAYYIESFATPYSATYVEWMLGQYFTELMDEVKKFADEDRILFQFQQGVRVNRHLRLDCENPKLKRTDDGYAIEIGKRHQDANLYPIDFFCVIDERLYIVPAEALKDGTISHAALDAWLARTSDQMSLPADFRWRFARERMVIGQPMT